MKKLLIAVLMMLGTSTVFAGDSEALKAILKAKTYDEAQSLVKSIQASMRLMTHWVTTKLLSRLLPTPWSVTSGTICLTRRVKSSPSSTRPTRTSWSTCVLS